MRIFHLELNTLLLKASALVFVCYASLGLIQVNGTHIVGAELYYECTSNSSNTYNVSLRLLRDCRLGRAPFDNPITIFAFSEAIPGNYLLFNVDLPDTVLVDPEEWDDCVGTPNPLCVSEAIYSRPITLPIQNGGWQLAWARCCRNSNIDNLSSPLELGVTFLARIPAPSEASCNSMPVFDNQLPIFICAGEEFLFDHAATDQDGDSLVYALTPAYDGINLNGQGAGNGTFGSPPPTVGPTNPMGLGPYRLVPYSFGYSPTDPFGPNTATIDANTGWLTFEAPNPGVFVVAVSVFEYRNGVLLSENKKDLQIHVINCLPQNDPPTIAHDLTGLNTIGDTILIEASNDFCYSATLTDTNQNPLNVLPVSVISSGSGSPTLTITGNVPGRLDMDICWEPGCEFNGADVELILMGYDETNCPIYNPAFDTVYVRILPPPDVIPLVEYDLSPVNSIGDTIIAEVNDAFCFEWLVADTFDFYTGDLDYTYVIEEVGGSSSFTPTINETLIGDSLYLEVCWTAGCANIDLLYRMIVRGVAENACPPNNFDLDSMYFFIPPLPNPPPVVGTDLSGNVIIQDTIQIDIHDELCYVLSVNDTFPAFGLGYEVEVLELDNSPAGGPEPTFAIVGTTDSLRVEVCWTPNCDNVDRTIAMAITGLQNNGCGQEAFDYDTVYIHINNIFNPPPVIGHSFLPGYIVDGDTIRIAADSSACYDFFLRDTVVSSFLSILGEVQALDGSPTGQNVDITVNQSLDTLLTGSVCVEPGCDFLDEQLMVILTGRDTFDCLETSWVFDTVFLDVTEPVNSEPEIYSDLSGLPVVNGLVQVEPSTEPYCYTVVVKSPNNPGSELTVEGVGRIFEEYFDYGNFAEITNVVDDDSLIVTVCWAPSCYDALDTFGITICGKDNSRCGLTDAVCETVEFVILDCSLDVQNVMTPNNDGINDVFEPFAQQGVDFYRFDIYDRWGVLVHSSLDGVWDGTWQGKGTRVPDGVYFYVIDYQFVSARGIPLRKQEINNLTVIR